MSPKWRPGCGVILRRSARWLELAASVRRRREQAGELDSAANEAAAKVHAEQPYAKPPRDERRDMAQRLARERWAEWARKKAG